MFIFCDLKMCQLRFFFLKNYMILQLFSSSFSFDCWGFSSVVLFKCAGTGPNQKINQAGSLVSSAVLKFFLRTGSLNQKNKFWKQFYMNYDRLSRTIGTSPEFRGAMENDKGLSLVTIDLQRKKLKCSQLYRM